MSNRPCASEQMEFSETGLTEDPKKINVPTSILHGDDDQIVPIAPQPIAHLKICI
jgi:hypothetical protein